MAHSRFGGSVMHRLMACPGFVKMSEGMPNDESPYAAEGTLLHDIASTILERGHDPRFHQLTHEQQDVVTAYTDFVGGERNGMAFDSATKMLIEQQFSMPDLHPEFFGTADCVLINDSELKVIDLKCGAGVSVEADYDGEPNPQLIFYMLGVLASLGADITPYDVELPASLLTVSLEIIIVQPRAGGIKRRTVTRAELTKYAQRFCVAANLADEPDAPVVAGKHCKFCRATAICPELKKMAVEKAQNEFGEYRDVPSMTDNELSEALDTANLIDLWVKAVRETAFARLVAGKTVPNYKIVERLGRRRWIDEAEAAKALLGAVDNLDDVVEVYDRKLKSPTQIEKAFKKSKVKLSMDGLVTRNTSQTLAHASDARNPSRLGPGDDFD